MRVIPMSKMLVKIALKDIVYNRLYKRAGGNDIFIRVSDTFVLNLTVHEFLDTDSAKTKNMEVEILGKGDRIILEQD